MDPNAPILRWSRIGFRIGLAAIFVFFWSMLLFGTPGMSVAEKLGIGCAATAVIVPAMWLRARHDGGMVEPRRRR